MIQLPSGRPIRRLAVLPLLAAAVLAIGCNAGGRAWGLMVASQEGSSGNSNTTDMNGTSPVYGFDNVIGVNSSSGVYLGNGWVLTASHVGAGWTSLTGGTYTPIGSSYFQMIYQSSTVADLIAYRLQYDPNTGLPLVGGMSLAQSSPTLNTPVTLVGSGFTSFSNNYWDSSWNDQTASSATYGGFLFGTTGIKRWGTNTIGASTPYSNAYGTQAGLLTQFYTGLNSGSNPATSGGNQSNVAQVASGDSGGGMFTSNHLAGILDSRGTFSSSGPGNAVFYSDVTYAIDVHAYASQINAATLTGEWTYTGSASRSWGTPGTSSPINANWNSGNGYVVPGGAGFSANFLGAITGNQTISIASALTMGSMTFGTTYAVALSGSTITLDNTTPTYTNGGGTSTGSVAVASQFTVTAGSHTISDALTIAGNGLLYLGITGSANSLTLSGNINSSSSPGSITKTGAGTATLSGTNTYAGGTTVSGGVLIFSTAASLPTSGTVTINSAGAAAFNFTGLSADLSRIAASSTGTVALTPASAAENLNFSSSGANLTGAFLGAVGTVTYTGTFTPSGSTYRFGGGGGTLTYGAAIGGANCVIIGGGNSGGTSGGTVVLTGANSYSAGTTLLSGELSIASDAAIGGSTSTVTFSGGILDVTGTSLTNFSNHLINASTFSGGFDIATTANNFTLNQNLSGSGSMMKMGPGTLTLVGSNAYTGGTTLSAGTLVAGSDHALGTKIVTLAPASGTATLSFTSAAPSIGSLTSSGAGSASIVLGNSVGPVNTNLTIGTDNTSPGLNVTSTLSYGGVTPFSGAISQAAGTTGSLTKVGSGTLVLSGADNYTGTTTLSGGTLQAVDGISLPAASLLVLDGGTFQGTTTTSTSFTRSLGTSGSNKFQWTANGGGFSANGGKLTVNIGNNLQQLTWGTSVGTNLVGPLNFGSNTANAQTDLQNPINLNGAARTVNVTAGLGNDFASLSGVISSSPTGGSLVKTGSGMLVLSGVNTYTGGTTINAGELSIANDSNLGGSNTPLTFNGGILQLTNSAVTNLDGHTVNWSTFSGGFDIFSANLAISENIGNGGTAGGTMIKLGTGKLTLSGNNTYSGGTTISEGTIIVASNTGLGTGQVAMTVPYNVAALDFTSAAPSIGSLTSVSSSYASGPSASLVLGSTGINTNLTIGTDNTSPAYPYCGTITQTSGATGSITKVGTGTLTLQPYYAGGNTVTNTYTGGTTINAGVLQFEGTPAVPASGLITVNAWGAVAFDFSNIQTMLTRINTTSAGTVALTASSANANIDFSSTGANLTAAFLGAASTITYTGTFTPNAGVYRLGGGGGTLIFGSAITGSSSVVICGAGTGTVILTGANSYTGGTTINAGTVSVSNAANMGANTSALTINNGTLDITAGFVSSRTLTLGTGSPTIQVDSGTYTLNNAPLGTGTLTKTGPGILQILAGGSINGLVKINALTVTAGTVDLTNHDLWIPNGAAALASLQHKVITSTSGPTINGITSVAIALVSEAEYQAATGTSVLDTQTIGANDLIGRFTYKGDANLDGKISPDDYLALNMGYMFGLKGWTHGDFEQTGTITAADFADIDTNYLHQSGPAADTMITLHEQWFGAAYTDAFNALNGIAPVPEPASLLLLTAGAAAMWSRKGRRTASGR